MIELFSKQGVSVPITTKMVWEAYKHVKQGGEAVGTDGITWEYLPTHYADDIIIHASREQIAQSILRKLQVRFTECGLTIHLTKIKIVCLTRSPTSRSVEEIHTFEMGGFAFTPQWVKVEGEYRLMVLPSPSKSAKKAIMDKIRSLRLHTRTGSIYVVANLLNPLVRGWQNYYCHFIKRDLNDIWRFVNKRLEKWCKWNKRKNLYNSRKWLHTLYKLQPSLFAHWSVCPAY